MNKNKREEILELLQSGDEYSEFRECCHVKGKLHMLMVSGSHAYGTAKEGSDIDIRGMVGLYKHYASGAINDWETKIFKDTDTVVHSYKKLLNLLAKGNPDAVVLVGLHPEDYLFLSPLGREFIQKHTDFLGAKGIYNSFIGYANAQLRRLELAEMGRLEGNQELVRKKKGDILENTANNFPQKYSSIEANNLSIAFTVPAAEGEKVIIKSINGHGIHIDDYFDIARDIKNVVTSFGSRGKREKKTDTKLNKHCMHTIRGMLMGIEALETGRIVTYREKDLPLLRSILAGDYMDSSGRMLPQFYELVEDLRSRATYAYKHTVLPQSPNRNKMADMLIAFMLEDFKK